MNARLKLLLASAAGIGAGTAMHMTGAEEDVIGMLFKASAPSFPLHSMFREFPWILSAAAGALSAAGIWLVLCLFSGSADIPVMKTGPDKESVSENSLYDSVSETVNDYLHAAEARDDTKDFMAFQEGGQVPESYFEQMYGQREEDLIFLNRLVDLLSKDKVSKSRDYLSDTHPELVVEEVRGLLQTTLYADYTHYVRSVRKALGAEEEKTFDWAEFSSIILGIRQFASSIKECLEFYLDMSRLEKNKFNKFKDYGVLPADVGMVEDADLYLIASEQKLGEQFDYSLLINFRGNTGELNIRFNPGIPEVFDFFDVCVAEIADHCTMLLSQDRHLFNLYELAFLSEGYRRIEWVNSNIETIKPESVSYYLETLKSSRDALRSDMKKLAITSLPRPLLQWDEIQEVQKRLEDRLKASSESQVIYKTESGRFKGVKPKEEKEE